MEAPKQKSKTKEIGGVLFIFGAGSLLLNLIGYDFAILFFLDIFGYEIGFLIRIAFIVVGIIMYLIGMKQEKS